MKIDPQTKTLPIGNTFPSSPNTKTDAGRMLAYLAGIKISLSRKDDACNSGFRHWWANGQCQCESFFFESVIITPTKNLFQKKSVHHLLTLKCKHAPRGDKQGNNITVITTASWLEAIAAHCETEPYSPKKRRGREIVIEMAEREIEKKCKYLSAELGGLHLMFEDDATESLVALVHDWETFIETIKGGLPDKPSGTAKSKDTTRAAYAKTHQEAFARLWINARNDLGRAPYVRDFLAENKTALERIGVKSEKDVRRIKDDARKGKKPLIPKWNTGNRKKQRKSKGNGRQ